ncbi:MAG: type II toxin-antitoxin system mRNA interferase toxin, RelE/StbE family [Candidatus Yanofskybacteria bacterium]|nr:type II toxin-antitoxin system mRNA interferase toxin, RelE/StbE family [Candidatus Yanofskybacteria bacterium]
MKIFYYSKFKQQFKKLPKEVKSLAIKKEKIFRINPFDLHLKTHKLHGELGEFWAFSINYQYRIIFDFADKNIIRFYAVGKHNIY